MGSWRSTAELLPLSRRNGSTSSRRKGRIPRVDLGGDFECSNVSMKDAGRVLKKGERLEGVNAYSLFRARRSASTTIVTTELCCENESFSCYENGTGRQGGKEDRDVSTAGIYREGTSRPNAARCFSSRVSMPPRASWISGTN